MAQVIFRGPGNARKNPFTQVVEGLNTAMAKRQASDLQSESNQALSDFASRIEGGGSSSQELVRLLKANPSAALALAQSKVPDILSAGEKQFKADAVEKKKASAFNKLMPAIKKSAEGIKSNPASGLFTSSGEIDPNFRLKERMSIDAVLNGMRSLTEDEFLAIKDEKFMQDILKNVANFTTGDVTKAEELLMSYTAGAAKDKRDFRSKLALETVKFQNDVQLTKEKAKIEGKPQNIAFGGKLYRVKESGDAEEIASAPDGYEIKEAIVGQNEIGTPIVQMMAINKSDPKKAIAVRDADGNVIKGPKASPKGKLRASINKDGTFTIEHGVEGGATMKTLNDQQAEQSQTAKGLALVNGLSDRLKKAGNSALGVSGVAGDVFNFFTAQTMNTLAAPEREKLTNLIESTRTALMRSVSADDRFSEGDRAAIENLFPKTGIFESEVQANIALMTLKSIFLKRMFLAQESNAPDKIERMSPQKAKFIGLTPDLLREMTKGGYINRDQALEFLKSFFPSEYSRLNAKHGKSE